MDQAERQLYGNPFTTKCAVDESKCIACKLCIRCGCPAISINRGKNKSEIDAPQCVGCEVCAMICPKKAIAKEVK